MRDHGNNREASNLPCRTAISGSSTGVTNSLASACTASGDPSPSTSLARSAGSSLMVVRPNPQSAACTGSTGSPDSVATARSVTIHSPPGSFTPFWALFCTVCTALSRWAISPSRRAALSVVDSVAPGPAARQTTPENGTPRSLAATSTSPSSSGSVSRFSGMQPGTLAASSSNPAINQVPTDAADSSPSSATGGTGTSCQPRVYSSRVASPPSPRSSASRGARLTVNSRIPPR
ncbi:Uncharacterised protein [Mycobacteroides abscessus subsp. abscessus]|nr:Uncharacterised protein [Mycobacteroides abscessus subsp. abscessus]